MYKLPKPLTSLILYIHIIHSKLLDKNKNKINNGKGKEEAAQLKGEETSPTH